MAKFPSSLMRTLDEKIHPFHRMSAVLVFCGACSLQAVVTSYLEPVSAIWFSLLITFPLTAGLTIIFLVVFRLNWGKLSFIGMLSGLALFVLLFLLLEGMSKALSLPDKAKHYILEQQLVEQAKRTADSLVDPVPFQQEAITKRKKLQDAIALRARQAVARQQNGQGDLARSLRDMGKDFSKQVDPEPRWYQRLLGQFSWPFVALYLIFADFYALYGPKRFWSGVLLAFLLALYFRSLVRKVPEKHL